MKGVDVRTVLPELRRRVGPDFHRADLARESGVSESHISRLESGERRLSVAVAKQLAPALGMTPVELYAHVGFEAVETDALCWPTEDMVQQIRAILIRGRWSQLARDGIVSLARATQPGAQRDAEDSQGRIIANNGILVRAI